LKIAIYILLTVVVLFAVSYVAGMLVSREHEASASAVINKAPVELFARIDNVVNYPTWRTGTTAARKLDSQAGVDRFEEVTGFGPIQYDVILRESPSKRVTRIVDGGGFGGTWTFDLVQEAGGTRVTITERGYIDSPIFRLMGKWVFGYDRNVRGYLADLQRAVEGRIQGS
jgi:hypothetical protein